MTEGDVIKAADGLSHGVVNGSRYLQDMSHEQIIRVAARRGFCVSRQYRQDTLRKKAKTLADRGILVGGRLPRFGDGHLYRATHLGLKVLELLEKRKRDRNATGTIPGLSEGDAE